MFCPPRLPFIPADRLRVYAVWSGICLVGATCIAMLIAFALAQEAPSWWNRVDRENPDTRRCANDLENGLLTTASQVRPTAPGTTTSAPWEFTVSAEDANAWLNTRLPRWLQNQSAKFDWPCEIAQIQVDFNDDRVYLGVQLISGASSQILTATVSPTLIDGALYAPAQSVALGRLPVPKNWFLSTEPSSMVEDRIPKPLRDLPETRGIAAAFAGRSPVAQTPVIKLGDGRRVRLLALTPKDGTLHITCCTEQR